MQTQINQVLTITTVFDDGNHLAEHDGMPMNIKDPKQLLPQSGADIVVKVLEVDTSTHIITVEVLAAQLPAFLSSSPDAHYTPIIADLRGRVATAQDTNGAETARTVLAALQNLREELETYRQWNINKTWKSFQDLIRSVDREIRACNEVLTPKAAAPAVTLAGSIGILTSRKATLDDQPWAGPGLVRIQDLYGSKISIADPAESAGRHTYSLTDLFVLQERREDACVVALLNIDRKSPELQRLRSWGKVAMLNLMAIHPDIAVADALDRVFGVPGLKAVQLAAPKSVVITPVFSHHPELMAVLRRNGYTPLPRAEKDFYHRRFTK